jgi:hypothetical protein
MKHITIVLILLLALGAVAIAQPSPSSRYPQSVTFTIANGQTASAAVNMGACTMAAIITPSVLSGTSFTFTHAQDGGTFNPVYDEFNAVKTIPVGTSRTILIAPVDYWIGGYWKIVSSHAEGAARTIKVICRN